MVPLRYLSNFLRTLKCLINCELSLENCKLTNRYCVVNQGATLSKLIKLNTPVLTLSTQNRKHLNNQNLVLKEQLTEKTNQYLGYLIDPNFKGVNRLSLYHLNMKHNKQVTNSIIFRL